jgi:hypothetical protein
MILADEGTMLPSTGFVKQSIYCLHLLPPSIASIPSSPFHLFPLPFSLSVPGRHCGTERLEVRETSDAEGIEIPQQLHDAIDQRVEQLFASRERGGCV